MKRLIKESTDYNGDANVTVPRELFRLILSAALETRSGFDEKFYLGAYPDVRDAVEKGQIKSGAAHYFLTGYLEDKLPTRLLVDEKFYLSSNPDIAEAIRRWQAGQPSSL